MPLVSLHMEKYIRPAPKGSITKKSHPYGVSSNLFSFFCLLRSYMGGLGSSMSIIHAFFCVFSSSFIHLPIYSILWTLEIKTKPQKTCLPKKCQTSSIQNITYDYDVAKLPYNDMLIHMTWSITSRVNAWLKYINIKEKEGKKYN